MELELLITELDQTTIQLDKINFLATRIMSIASVRSSTLVPLLLLVLEHILPISSSDSSGNA